MDQITTRLEWAGSSGYACHQGVSIHLLRPPGRAVEEIHYTPGMQAEVRERACDAKRLMTADEIREADRWLRVMAWRAREAIGQLPFAEPTTATTGDPHGTPAA